MSFVVGLGKLNIDLIYSGLSRIPNEGEEIYSSGFDIKLGGGTPATLVALKRLGIPVKLATCLGKDIFSRFAEDKLLKEGIVPLNLYGGEGCAVNVSSALITPRDRTFVTYGEDTYPDDKMLEKIYEMSKGAKVAIMQRGCAEVYRQLKKEGVILVLDIGWEDNLSIDSLSEYLSLADYFTPNKIEALKITGASDVEEAGKILAEYLDKVIIKLDNRGCFAMDGKKSFYVSQIETYGNKDSIGAGDAFLAGLIYGIYKGYGFYDSILCGNISGGKCVTETGCLTARLCEKELLEVLSKLSVKL